ncbi:MAG: hypothetical protein ACE5H9_04170 [Anaerolineae bacterium]
MKKHFLVVTVLLVLLLTFSASALAQGPSSYTSGFQLQNLSSSQDATVVITYYNQDGTVASTVNDTVTKSSSKTYFPLSAVSDGFNGSVVISSNQPVAAIANILGDGGSFGGASYDSASAGATSVSVPLVIRNAFGINTWFNVQNAGSGDASVTVTYAGSSNITDPCTQTDTIKPGAAKTFIQNQVSCLSDGFIGAATITSNEPVVAAIVQYDNDSLLAQNGFTGGSTNPVFPLVVNNIFNTWTGIQIQNTGGSSTDVTVTYTPLSGQPGATCTEQQTIPSGESKTFGINYLTNTSACQGANGYVGSAAVTGNSANQALVGLVNQVDLNGANASAYNGFDPASGTATVNIPLIINDFDLGGGNKLFTGFNVVNVGSQQTSVNCTFASSTYTASGTLNPGEALNDVQTGNSTLGAGYVGAATCTATGGDASIVGVVNQLGGSGDAILTYEAFNQ